MRALLRSALLCALLTGCAEDGPPDADTAPEDTADSSEADTHPADTAEPDAVPDTADASDNSDATEPDVADTTEPDVADTNEPDTRVPDAFIPHDPTDDPAGTLRVDQLQALGTHNSYHILAGPPAHPSHAYEHPPLRDQLDQGIRHFELDVHRDPAGGPHRVYHIVHVDPASTCDRLADCFAELRDWSLANPHHHLIVILLEPADHIARLMLELGNDPNDSGEGLWDGHFATLDDVARASFGAGHLLTPAAVRARSTPPAATLRESLATLGFPTVAETRGQIALVLNDTGAGRAEYRATGDDLLFVFGEVGDDDVAFVKADNPRSNPERIRRAVAAGYLVRTRADADLELDPDRRELALSTGAQLISTDFPRFAPVTEDQGVWLEGGAPSRCNPVSAPPDCDSATIEPHPSP